jgi:hypothetical protein
LQISKEGEQVAILKQYVYSAGKARQAATIWLFSMTWDVAFIAVFCNRRSLMISLMDINLF